MGTMNAFYVRDDGTGAAAIRKRFPGIELEENGGWIGGILDEEAFEPPREQLQGLSKELNTDTLWLSFQSVVDAFQFYHWSKGMLARELVYGCYEEERTWERATGAPESWEKEVFFSQKQLDRALKFADPDEQKVIREIWREQKIAAGNVYPGLDSRDRAWAVAQHYGLPHYG